MTRKDYIALAAALKAARHFEPDTIPAHDFNYGVTTAARRLTEVLAADNPRFDRSKFLSASGIQS